jgi:hypothetical protein
MTIELSIETADRVLDRVRNGVVTFRAMNTTEEMHVLTALHHWRELAYGIPDLLAENAALRAEVEDCRRRARDGINID